MALGDALAIALMEKRGFKQEDFASFHPGGSLGKKLFVKIKDLMRTEEPCHVSLMTRHSSKRLLLMMSEGKLGTVLIQDSE